MVSKDVLPMGWAESIPLNGWYFWLCRKENKSHRYQSSLDEPFLKSERTHVNRRKMEGKKPVDYLPFFSLSLRHRPIATNIRPMNQAKYPYIPKLINSPPDTKDEANIIMPIITNNAFIMLILSPHIFYYFFYNNLFYFKHFWRFSIVDITIGN